MGRDNDMKMSEHCTKKIAEIAKVTDATIVGPAASSRCCRTPRPSR